MPTTKNLMGANLVSLQATSILGSVDNAKTATGTGQSDAFQVVKDITVFSTVAAGTGARLPSNLAQGDEITIANNGANALLVYPPTGAAIGTAAVNAGVSVAAGKLGVFTLITPTLFIASVGA